MSTFHREEFTKFNFFNWKKYFWPDGRNKRPLTWNFTNNLMTFTFNRSYCVTPTIYLQLHLLNNFHNIWNLNNQFKVVGFLLKRFEETIQVLFFIREEWTLRVLYVKYIELWIHRFSLLSDFLNNCFVTHFTWPNILDFNRILNWLK